jgi:hypothetical protein
VSNINPRPFLPPGNIRGNRRKGGGVEPRGRLDGTKKFAPTRIRSVDHPTRSDSLCGLSYLDPHKCIVCIYFVHHAPLNSSFFIKYSVNLPVSLVVMVLIIFMLLSELPTFSLSVFRFQSPTFFVLFSELR